MKLSKLFAIVALLGLGAFLVSAKAATVTNADGTVFTVNTLPGDAASIRDTRVRDDQSTYVGQDQRVGVIVRDFRVSEDGGAVGVINLGAEIPANTLIHEGFIQVIDAVLPATATCAVHVVGAGDILAAGTTLGSDGLKDVVPADAIANAVLVATNSYLKLTISGSAATSGVFSIVLPTLRVQ